MTTLPLIDVLLVLLLFLLSLFDPRGESCDHRALDLPEAAHGVALAPGPVINLDAAGLRVNGALVAPMHELSNASDAKPLSRMRELLVTLRRNHSILHPEEAAPSHVIVQAERGLPYARLRRVLSVSAEAGFASVSFLVKQRSRTY